jgi:hypothetical protein
VALITEIAMAFDTTVDPLLVEAGLLPKPPESIVWTPELIQIQQMLNTLNVSREYELLHEALQLVLAIGEQAAAESDDGGETCNDLVNSSL